MTALGIASLLLLLLLLAPPANPSASGVANNVDDGADEWSACRCPASDPAFDASAARPPSARMAYLISVHNRRTIGDGARLLRALVETSHPGDTAAILIHVDARAGIASRGADGADPGEEEEEEDRFAYHDSPLRRYVDACLATPACARKIDAKDAQDGEGDATVLEVHSHFSPAWSKWSMNDPTLWALEYLAQHPGLNPRSGDGSCSPSWDVFVNLSGDTLPVATAARISRLFEPREGPLGNTNFVTSASCATGLVPTSILRFPEGTMKRAHYSQKGVPEALSYVDLATGEWREDVAMPVHFGSQWMALTRGFAEHAVGSLSHPNGIGAVLKHALIETEVLMTDETFFATLLMNSPAFADTIPKLDEDGALERYPSMRALRYERMDENAPNAWGKFASSDPLYDVPPGFRAATGGEGPARPWGPYFLGAYDLGAIKDSGALFVRKVSGAVDENLVRLLPVRDVREGRSEWDELPDVRWPGVGVRIRDPFVWALQGKVDDDEGEGTE